MSKQEDVLAHGLLNYDRHELYWCGMHGAIDLFGKGECTAKQLGMLEDYPINCYSFPFKLAAECGYQSQADAKKWVQLANATDDSRVKAFYHHWYYGFKMSNYPVKKPAAGDIVFFKNRAGNIFAHVAIACGTQTVTGQANVLSLGHNPNPSGTAIQSLRVEQTTIEECQRICNEVWKGAENFTVSFITPEWVAL